MSHQDANPIWGESKQLKAAPAPNSLRRGWQISAAIVIVVLAVGVAMGVSEYHKPGWFYNVVGTRVHFVGDAQGDSKLAKENRSLLGEYSRQASQWPGVLRTSWPTLVVPKPRLPQLARFSVTVDRSRADWGLLTSNAHEIVHRGRESNMELVVDLNGGRCSVRVGDVVTIKEMHDLVALSEPLEADRRILRFTISFGVAMLPEPGLSGTEPQLSLFLSESTEVQEFKEDWDLLVQSAGIPSQNFKVRHADDDAGHAF